jgi:hypothetical protein
MTFTAEEMLSDFGSVLPLQRGRKDALALYARRSAKLANARSAQRWVEDTWGLRDYEAKELLKGNASEAVWERIVKHKNGGWGVVLPIIGAVIGHGIDEYAAEKHRRKVREREQIEAEERQLAAVAGDMRSLLSLVIGGAGQLSVAEGGEGGEQPLDLGADEDYGPARPVEVRSYAPRRGRP